MPDDNSLRDAVRRSTAGHLSENPAATDRDIVVAITRRLGIGEPGDVLQIWGYVRGARRTWEQGGQFQNQPDQNKPAVPTATDPALRNEIANYRYRTIIEITDPRTGHTYSNVVPVDSTIPLTPNEIRDEAMAQLTTVRGPDRHYINAAELGGVSTPVVRIIGGGRKSA